MSKATEQELAELHGVVARVLKEELQAEAIVVDADGNESKIRTVSPAMMGQAVKFLKDNKITSNPDLDDNLDELKNTLEKKQKRGSVLHMRPVKAAGEESA